REEEDDCTEADDLAVFGGLITYVLPDLKIILQGDKNQNYACGGSRASAAGWGQTESAREKDQSEEERKESQRGGRRRERENQGRERSHTASDTRSSAEKQLKR